MRKKRWFREISPRTLPDGKKCFAPLPRTVYLVTKIIRGTRPAMASWARYSELATLSRKVGDLIQLIIPKF